MKVYQFNVYDKDWNFIRAFYQANHLGFTSDGDYRYDDSMAAYVKFMGEAPEEKREKDRHGTPKTLREAVLLNLMITPMSDAVESITVGIRDFLAQVLQEAYSKSESPEETKRLERIWERIKQEPEGVE